MDADNGSDYGYDLSADDEAVLSQLIDSIPQRVDALPSLLSPALEEDEELGRVSPAADGGNALERDGSYPFANDEGNTQSAIREPGLLSGDVLAAIVPGRARPVVAGEEAGRAAFVEDAKPRSVPAFQPFPIVRYPDCEFYPPIIRVERVRRVLDISD
jgi:hypothetical protein